MWVLVSAAHLDLRVVLLLVVLDQQHSSLIALVLSNKPAAEQFRREEKRRASSAWDRPSFRYAKIVLRPAQSNCAPSV